MSISPKIISLFAMLLGYAIIAVPTGILTAELASRKGKSVDCDYCKQTNLAMVNFCSTCGKKLNNDNLELKKINQGNNYQCKISR